MSFLLHVAEFSAIAALYLVWIIGAGLLGLAAAYERRGWPIIVFIAWASIGAGVMLAVGQ